MSKRAATTDLNHENWDREDEKEEPGEPQAASAEVISKRVIKTAKRRMDSQSSETRKNPFAGFGGFSSLSKPSTTENSTLFNSSFIKDTTNKNSENTTLFKSAIIKDSINKNSEKSNLFNSIVKETSEKPIELKKNSSKYSDNYCKKIKSLNLCFVKWITKHIDENAICNLEPTFRDYEKHLKEIESEEEKLKNGDKESNENKFTISQKNDFSQNSGTIKPISSSPPVFSFGSYNSTKENPKSNIFANPFTPNSKPDFTSFSSSTASSSTNNNKDLNKEDKTEVFTFGKKIEDNDSKKEETTSSPSLFSFGKYSSPPSNNIFGGIGKTNSLSTPPSGFSFMAPATTSKENTESEVKKDEEASEEPPKNEFTQVIEDDAKYSQRCKVFIKKDADYQERGIGTLYLKPVPNSNRTQLIVRADTNLGTLLVNLLLTDQVPIKLMGKKDVMLVGKPTPNEETPKPILLRVKDKEMANKLHAELEKSISESS